MNLNKKTNLKLIAKNEEDLNVISAYLQDSIILVKDIVFLKKNRSFVVMANRFMWEDVEKGVFRKNKRIRCAIKFGEVLEVKSKNINQKNKNFPIEFLAIKCSSAEDDIYKIRIFFAGDSMITLKAEVIEVALEDLGNSWDVKYIPKHKI